MPRDLMPGSSVTPRAGKFDRLAEESLREFRAGRAREL